MYKYYLKYIDSNTFIRYNFDTTIPFDKIPDSCLEDLIIKLQSDIKKGEFYNEEGIKIGSWKRRR
jgi:hypothetical protein